MIPSVQRNYRGNRGGGAVRVFLETGSSHVRRIRPDELRVHRSVTEKSGPFTTFRGCEAMLAPGVPAAPMSASRRRYATESDSGPTLVENPANFVRQVCGRIGLLKPGSSSHALFGDFGLGVSGCK
jgi:hypothetical protein